MTEQEVLAQFKNLQPFPSSERCEAWRGTDPLNGGKPVVIKRISVWKAKEPMNRSFSLDHPSIARCKKWFVCGGHLYVVRQYVEGQPLLQHIRQAADEGDLDVATLMNDLLSGLETAHGYGLFHGRLHPDNVLVAPDGQVVLTDFGCAVRNDKQVRRYVAPERQIGSDAREPDDPLTPAHDVYSVGSFIMDAVGSGLVGDDERKAALEVIAERCRADDPAGRYPSLGGLAEAWKEALRKPPSPPPPLPVARFEVHLHGNMSAPMKPKEKRTGKLTVGNTGDLPITIEAVESDVGWLTRRGEWAPTLLPPKEEQTVSLQISAPLIRDRQDGHVVVRTDIAGDQSIPVSPPPIRGIPPVWRRIVLLTVALLLAVAVIMLIKATPRPEEAKAVVRNELMISHNCYLTDPGMRELQVVLAHEPEKEFREIYRNIDKAPQSVCIESGQLAATRCPKTEKRYFLMGRTPTSVCSSHGP